MLGLLLCRGYRGTFFHRVVDKPVDFLWIRLWIKLCTGVVDKFIPRLWIRLGITVCVRWHIMPCWYCSDITVCGLVVASNVSYQLSDSRRLYGDSEKGQGVSPTPLALASQFAQ